MENREEFLSLLGPDFSLCPEGLLLADGPETLVRLNEGSRGPDLTRVGLCLIPDGFDDGALSGVRVSELAGLASRVRSLRRITVRGCSVRGWLQGLRGQALGRFFRAGYEGAKRMTVLLPCAMPYLCFEGVLEALARNREAEPGSLEDALTAARIVAMQNRTAFYARLYVT